MTVIPERIIDAHHHLWDLDAVHYPWLMEKGQRRFFGDPTPIQKNYDGDDFQQDIGSIPIKSSVHIQVGAQEDEAVQETLWLERERQRTGFPGAIVAFTDLTSPNMPGSLDRHALASSRLRGVRQIVSRSADEDRASSTPDLLYNVDFSCGLHELSRRDLSFDLQLTPQHLHSAAGVLGDIEGLRVALCHAGSLHDSTSEGLSAWTSGLATFADQVDGICKISGYGMFYHHWQRQDIKDWVHRIIDVFTPQRVAFGSNFPVDRLYASYHDVWNAFFYAAEAFTPEERDLMFWHNAEDFYRVTS
ncbi:MAG: amidohydrolase family protein [Pseudomonadota bacterium]